MPHNPSTEDWCILADMEEGDYLMMDPACEVNEKGTRGKNDLNEVVEEGSSPPLDLDPNEVIEADEEALLPFTIQTRQRDRTRLTKKHNPYGDDFVVDRIDLKKILEELVDLEEITVSQDIDIVDDRDEEWIVDRQSYEQDLTNLRVLEWLNEMTSDPKENSVMIQDVDRESMKYIKPKGMILPGQPRKGNYSFLHPTSI